MQTITLYRYQRDGGGVTVSPIMPDSEYTILHRIVSDDGKELTNGTTTTTCADVDSAEGWIEVDAQEEEGV